jgi:hypothetical protein
VPLQGFRQVRRDVNKMADISFRFKLRILMRWWKRIYLSEKHRRFTGLWSGDGLEVDAKKTDCRFMSCEENA